MFRHENSWTSRRLGSNLNPLFFFFFCKSCEFRVKEGEGRDEGIRRGCRALGPRKVPTLESCGNQFSPNISGILKFANRV